MEGQTSQYMFSSIQITPGFSCRLWVVIKSHSYQHTIVTASRSIPQVLHQYCLMLLKSNHFRKWNVPGMIVEARCAAILRKGPASGWWSKKRNLFYICSFVCIWWWLIHPRHSPNILIWGVNGVNSSILLTKKKGMRKFLFAMISDR